MLQWHAVLSLYCNKATEVQQSKGNTNDRLPKTILKYAIWDAFRKDILLWMSNISQWISNFWLWGLSNPHQMIVWVIMEAQKTTQRHLELPSLQSEFNPTSYRGWSHCNSAKTEMICFLFVGLGQESWQHNAEHIVAFQQKSLQKWSKVHNKWRSVWINVSASCGLCKAS